MPLVNPLILGNLYEYHHKSYIAKKTIFNHFDVIGLQCCWIR